MALQFVASIYRINQYDLNSAPNIPATMGVPNSFPSQGVRSYPITTAAVTANGVVMNSIIALLPTGLNEPEEKFYTDRTVAQIATLANT
jgi:hypothetical protein